MLLWACFQTFPSSHFPSLTCFPLLTSRPQSHSPVVRNSPQGRKDWPQDTSTTS